MPEPEYKRCPQCGQPFQRSPHRSQAQWDSQRFDTPRCAHTWNAAQRCIHGATTHFGRSPEYQSWASMKSRCLNPKANAYDQYGGRGITICDAWRYDFAQFLADMGQRPDGTSLDRIDPDGHYELANCRWATAKEQANNRRRSGLIRLCTVEGCATKILALGMCSMHYQRQRREATK